MGSIDGSSVEALHASTGGNREHTAANPDGDLFQDVMSQFPFLNGYTNLVFGFALPIDHDQHEIVVSVRDAVDSIAALVPWLAGQVLHTNAGPGNSGVYRPAPWPATGPRNDIVRAKDCRPYIPSMTQLLRTSAPISVLDGSTLTPWPSLPFPHGIEGAVPICALQLNFIEAGLLLNVSFHHNVVDATGILQFARLLADTLAGRDIDSEAIVQANRDRRCVVPLLARNEPMKDHSHLRKAPGYSHVPLQDTSLRWCYFKIPTSLLSPLRTLASLPEGGSKPVLISENDIICAFCWQRLTFVRLARRSPAIRPEMVGKFNRAIDGRSAVGVPFTYMGHMVYHAYSWMSLGQVASAPLGAIAQTLRRDLNAVNNAWAVRSFATYLAREPDKSQLLYTGKHNANIDIGATSIQVSAGDARRPSSILPDFGPLGELKFGRRPNSTPIPGSVTIGAVENGAIPIALCVPEVDIADLRKDAKWKQFTRYIG